MRHIKPVGKRGFNPRGELPVWAAQRNPLYPIQCQFDLEIDYVRRLWLKAEIEALLEQFKLEIEFQK